MAQPSRSRRWLRRFTLYIVVPYALFCIGMAVGQRRFVYVPLPGPSVPQEAELAGYSAQTLPAADGTPILYWETTNTAEKPLVFYFHGNGGGLFMFVPTLTYLQAQGFHVIAMEYRGYPGTSGSPTQTNIVADATTLYEAISARYPKQKRIIWGYSLGSGIASQLAATHHPTALVLEAPFTAVVDRAQEMFPLLPVPLILKDQYRSAEVITQIDAPLLILHGDADLIIPISHGEKLFAAAAEPKTLKTYPGAGHLDLQKYGAYEDAMTFIRGALQK